MTWTYDGPSNGNPKGIVRFLVQDTNTLEQLVTDEEINWVLTQHSTARAAAAEVADTIARKFARQATVTDGGTKIDYGQRAQAYRDLAKELRSQAVAVSAFAGGISQADKDARDADTDRVKPLFSSHQFDVNANQDAEGD